MDRELAAGDRKDRGGGVSSKAMLFVNSRTWRRKPDVRTASRPDASRAGCISSGARRRDARPRSGTTRRARAGLSRSSIRALGVESQMSVPPGGRMHRESRGRSARTSWRRHRVKVGQLQAAPLMLELGLALGLGEGWLRPLASRVSNSCSRSRATKTERPGPQTWFGKNDPPPRPPRQSDSRSSAPSLIGLLVLVAGGAGTWSLRATRRRSARRRCGSISG
jgi:hypothetical protein